MVHHHDQDRVSEEMGRPIMLRGGGTEGWAPSNATDEISLLKTQI